MTFPVVALVKAFNQQCLFKRHKSCAQEHVPRYVCNANEAGKAGESGLGKMQAMRPQQLAVFFRNNHFSVLFKRDGALMTLVTDQGYLHEKVGVSPTHMPGLPTFL